MNQGSNFLGGRFNDRDNARAQIQFRREINPSILEDDDVPKNRPIHFASIEPLDQSDKTS